MVINTNTQALQTANSLNASNTNLAKALSRLSSGAKIVVPSDDAAGLAVSSRLEAQIKRLDSAVSNVINAISFTQTQDGFLKTIDKALSRMGELAMFSQDTTKSDEDRALYNQEFAQLKDYILASVDQTYNSVSLFSSSPIGVTIDSEGTTFAMLGINLNAPVYQAAINTNTDAWKLTSDLWQVSKDGFKATATTYKTSVDLWRNSAGTWSATDNGGAKVAAGSFVTDNVSSVDTGATSLATNSFLSKAVTLTGFTTDYLANKLTKTSHGLVTGDKIKLPSGAPNGTTSTTEYFVNVSGNDITLHTTKANATAGTSAVNLKAPTSAHTTLTGGTADDLSNMFTFTGHGLADGDKVRITSNAPGGTNTTTTYYVKLDSIDGANRFKLHTDSSLMFGSEANVSTVGTSISLESNKLTGVSWEYDDDVLTKINHGLSTGDVVQVTENGATLTSENVNRYVKKLTDNTFELYTDAALTTQAIAFSDGVGLRLNIETGVTQVENHGNAINKGQFASIDPTLSGEDTYAQKIASGSVVAINKSTQDLTGFATELGADYDNVNILTLDSAQITLALVRKATGQIANDRAILGAMQSRLNFTHDRLTVTKENLSTAVSRIADVDVAVEATQYARYQILVQSGTSMLREANAMPQSALKLLQ